MCAGMISNTNKEAKKEQCGKSVNQVTSKEGKNNYTSEYFRILRILREMPTDLGDLVVLTMDVYDLDVKKVAKKSGLSPKTIGRIRSTPDYKPTLETMMQLCIGMEIPADISFKLISKAGYHLRSQGIDQAYRFIILGKVGCTLQDANAFLDELGYPNLGKI